MTAPSIGDLFDLLRGTWQAEALCPQVDTESFFPDKGGSTREAKAICALCPVASQCLQQAMEADERFGIWGGLSEQERRRFGKWLAVQPPTTPFPSAKMAAAIAYAIHKNLMVLDGPADVQPDDDGDDDPYAEAWDAGQTAMDTGMHPWAATAAQLVREVA